MIGMRKRIARRKPATVPLCPPQIPHDVNRARTRVAAMVTATNGLYMRLSVTEPEPLC
jgi:hypothetical protein